MANLIPDVWGTATALTISLESTVVDGAGRQSTMIVDASPVPPRIMISFLVTTGTSPTVNTAIEFYLARSDNAGTPIRDGGTGASDAAFTGNKTELSMVHAIQVTATSDTSYRGSFEMEDPSPEWALVVFNETGATLNTTGSNQVINYRTMTPEIAT